MRTRAATPKVWVALLFAMSAAAMVVALAVGSEPAKAAFPGSNGAIAFQAGQIYRMNSDGFGQTQLSNTPDDSSQPYWSADGKKIAFVGFLSGSNNNEIYWMDSDGSGETNLTNNSASDRDPAFFPDYHKIAFTSNRAGGDFDIFKMTVDDNGNVIGVPTQLTTSTALDFSPAVSPGGKKIAFQRAGDIYVMKANAPESATNKAVKLTKSAAGDSSPDWSPSGKKIAFESNRSGNFEVYTMKPVPESRTNRPKNLTNNSADDRQPAFSPDGRKIAFASDRDGGDDDIFKMKADGSGVVNLTNNSAADEAFPSWQPDP